MEVEEQDPDVAPKKTLIEQAYTQAPALGLAVWGMDEAGPYQAIPQPGICWQPLLCPTRYPHEHVRHGTAKLLTLFHPSSGTVRVNGVRSSPNAVLHAWLKQQLLTILAGVPPAPEVPEADNRSCWQRWQAGLTVKPTLPAELPRLRLLLIMDNLAGHKTRAFVEWPCAHGVMPLYTPFSGSWWNVTESVQRIISHRVGWPVANVPGGHYQLARTNRSRLERRPHAFHLDGVTSDANAARLRRHPLGGSGACTTRPIRRRPVALMYTGTRATILLRRYPPVHPRR